MRHLLIFIHMADVQPGYLFTPWRYLKSFAGRSGEREAPNSHLSYNTFLAAFKKILKEAIPTRARILNLGLHTFRKTGYIFAVWGKGEWSVIKADARHKSDEVAQQYCGDSYSLMLHQASIFNDPKNKVKTYQQSYCENPQDCAIDANEYNTRGVSMRQLAREYFASLEVPADQQTDIGFVLSLAYKSRNKTKSCELFSTLEKQVSPEQSKLLKEALSAASAESREHVTNLEMQLSQLQVQLARMQSDQAGTRNSTGSNHDTEEARPPVAVDKGEEQPRKKRKMGSNDLPARNDVAKEETLLGKLCKLQGIEASVPESTSQLTGAAKKWVNATLRPVMRCLENHHGGDKDLFCKFWESKGGFRLKDFGSKCCSGHIDAQGLTCGSNRI